MTAAIEQEEIVTLQTVTPEDAQRFLATKAINRPVLASFVSFLARQIELGRWHPTAGTLGFNEDGQLNDGQHRCEAIIRAGIPVEIGFRTVRQSDLVAVDTGKSRTAAHGLALRNIEHPTTVSGVIRGVANIRQSAGAGAIVTKAGALLSNEEVWETVRAEPQYVLAASVGQELRGTCPFLTPSELGALFFVFANATDDHTAREFLLDIAEDRQPTEGLTHAVRVWLLRAEASRRKPSRRDAVLVCLGAWNRWIRNERSGKAQRPRKVPSVLGTKPGSDGDRPTERS